MLFRSTDTPVPGDYDGDGATDVAIFRPSTGTWWILQSSTNYTTYGSHQWGEATDIPVPGDYDGDGYTDVSIFRPSTDRRMRSPLRTLASGPPEAASGVTCRTIEP